MSSDLIYWFLCRSSNLKCMISTNLYSGIPVEHREFEHKHHMKTTLRKSWNLVEGFWVCYCHLARPSSFPSPTDLHLFKEGIRPLWEMCTIGWECAGDSANRNGGKWIIRFKRAVSGRFWEDLVLALVGDQLDYGDNICGAVLSIRFNEDILSLWNRNASDHQ
ncbi:Translation Initiation factor eIF- 4e, partial [Dillenia turbinata]